METITDNVVTDERVGEAVADMYDAYHKCLRVRGGNDNRIWSWNADY